MKKIVVIFVVLLVASVATFGAISTKLTTVSLGIDGDAQPIYTLMGFYDMRITVYSGETYYLGLDNGSFTGWFTATDGWTYQFQGTYLIEGRQVSGTWRIGQVTGWLSGTLGI